MLATEFYGKEYSGVTLPVVTSRLCRCVSGALPRRPGVRRSFIVTLFFVAAEYKILKKHSKDNNIWRNALAKIAQKP